MCLACTALQHHVPRPENTMLQTAPRSSVHYVAGLLLSDESGWIHRYLSEWEGAFLHLNDAIEDAIVSV